MKTHKAIRSFGRAIREVRRARNLTLEGLAELIDTDPAWIAKVERGEKNISLLTAVRLAEALSIDLTFGDCKLVKRKK